MELRILAVGDVVGESGLGHLRRHLGQLKKETKADFCIVNGENAALRGLTPDQAEELLYAGADVITLGNHAFQQRSIFHYLDDCKSILRPYNFAPQTPGRGWGMFECKGTKIAVMNLIGRHNMDYGPDNPFTKMDALLPQLDGCITLLDFHAESTSEKLAMGYMLDGKVSAVFGTHTHVPTADAQVLPKGTGYVTDLGMTGPGVSVLGIRPEQSIAMFRGELTSRFEAAPGKCVLQAVCFTIDSETKLCKNAERVDYHA